MRSFWQKITVVFLVLFFVTGVFYNPKTILAQGPGCVGAACCPLIDPTQCATFGGGGVCQVDSNTGLCAVAPTPTATPTPTPADIVGTGGTSSQYSECSQVPPGTDKWVFDAKVTETGKRAERARQFINWAITHPAIDNHPIFRSIWLVSAGTAFLLIILVVVFMGINVIVVKRKDVSFKVDFVPIIQKVGMLLLYVAFSYVIVWGIIQISDILMTFFIRVLKADELFKIFFTIDSNSETGYRSFIGKMNCNPLARESVNSSLFLINLTSVTYFVLGAAFIIRRIVLWFLLFVSPFLAVLMPFVFIRNTGWIWIGVFFQWVFYGPLVALFLGALNRIWQAGIPFSFNFSRAVSGDQVYPQAINILYGGPSQVGTRKLFAEKVNETITKANSANYIDTFMEYVIALLMLWLVVIVPWWLLRIFRDYCCEGIYAVRNILMNMFGAQGPGGPGLPPSSPGLPSQKATLSQELPKESKIKIEQTIATKFENLEEVKKMQSEEISKKLDLQIKKVTDIAQVETKKDVYQKTQSILNYMRNPLSAENSRDRQSFIQLKTELGTRASRGDQIANKILTATNTASTVFREEIQRLAKSQVQLTSLSNVLAKEIGLTNAQTTQAVASLVNNVVANQTALTNIAQKTNSTQQEVNAVLQSLPAVIEQAKPASLASQVAQKTNISEEKANQILKESSAYITAEQAVKQASASQRLASQKMAALSQSLASRQKAAPGIVKAAAAQLIEKSANVSLDEYEEIKKMWKDHYKNGEVPLSAEITNRKDWLQKDQVKLDNVLNKIVSENEELRAEGLREVADIIPFFILGDMSLQDIATYLKAKQTAAIETSESLEQMEAFKQEMQGKQEEEYVEVKRVAEKPQEMVQTLEMKLEEEMQKVKAQGQTETAALRETIASGQERSAKLENLLREINVNINHLTDVIRLEQNLAGKAPASETLRTDYKEVQKISQVEISEKIHELSSQKVVLAPAINTLSSFVNETKEKVGQVLQNVVNTLNKQVILTQKIAQASQTNSQTVNQIISALPGVVNTTSNSQINAALAKQTQNEPQTVEKVMTNTGAELVKDQASLQEISRETQLSTEKVTAIVKELLSPTVQEAAMLPIIKSVSSLTNEPPEKVVQALNKAVNIVNQQTALTQKIAQVSQTNSQTVNQLLTALPTVISTTPGSQLNTVLTAQTKVEPQIIEKVLSNTKEELVKDTNTLQEISRQSNTNVEKTTTIIKEIFTPSLDKGQTKAQVDAKGRLSKGQLRLKNVLADIQASDKISLEEYEQMKRMWIDHYTNGEVPFSEKIKTRLDWVTQEAILLDNLLNKLVSENQLLRQEGLKEIAEIIPFFVLGNMSLQEIAVYLKAKKAAAEEVRENILKEEMIKKQLESQVKQEEVFVPASQTAKPKEQVIEQKI